MHTPMPTHPLHAAALALGLALGLVLLPTSAALADQVGGVHVVFEEDYQSARLTEEVLARSRDICNRLLMKELEIRGDTSLVGKARVEEYHSADGKRRSTVRQRHLNLSKDPCVIDILPITEKKLSDHEQGVVYRYNSRRPKPWSKGRLMSTGQAAEVAGMLMQSGWTGLLEGQRPIGKDTVAGVACDIYQPKDDITVCTWTAAKSGDIQHPSLLNLRYQIRHQDGKVDTATAVLVNLRAAIDAELLLPPAEALAAK